MRQIAGFAERNVISGGRRNAASPETLQKALAMNVRSDANSAAPKAQSSGDRLFFLSASTGQVLSMNPDGSTRWRSSRAAAFPTEWRSI